MINSSTLRLSNAIPQIASNAMPGTLGTQKNTLTPRTLDEKVGQLLLEARSLGGADEARRVAEILEKMLDPKLQITLSTRRRCFRGLVKLCGQYGVLPSSYIIPDSKVEKLGYEPISVGGFSQVWPGVYEGEKSVAIKIIQYYEKDGVQAIKKGFCREVLTWRRLSHPNVLELIGVMMSDRECAMVAPWMENGNIVDYVREEPQVNSLRLLVEATRGLQYLHSVDLAHGDLKGGNILISEEGHACLADVGLTRVACDQSSNTATNGTTSSEGGFSMRWCSPEILDPERFGFKRGSPTKKSDVYSMAMTIYQVLTDKIPFHDCSDLYAMLRIVEGLRPEKPKFPITRGYTEELWDMTVSCWKENPIDRPMVDKLLEALEVAGERWKPRLGQLPTDDRSPSHTLPEPKDHHAATEPPHNNLPEGEEYKPAPTPEATNPDVPTNRTRKEDLEKVSTTPETEGVQRTPPALPEAQTRASVSADEVEGTTPIEPNLLTMKGKADTTLTALPQSLPKPTPAIQAPSTGDPTHPEPKPAPITVDAPNSSTSPKSYATQTPAPTSSPIDPVHPPPISTLSATEDRIPPRSRLTSAASRNDLVNPMVPMRLGEEDSALVPSVAGEEETRSRSRSARPTRKEEPEPISVTSGKGGTKTGADKLSIHEERRPTLAPPEREGILQAPIIPLPQLEQITTSRDIRNEVAPVNPSLSTHDRRKGGT